MARSVLPNALVRREWIEQSLDAQRALRVAEAYLAEGRSAEAVVFLLKADARDRLEALRDQAVREGDAFLLREACRALGGEAEPTHWRALAEAAAAAGKQSYAAEASRQAERMEG
jgi:hypothetical protein